jgi:hypothetical protein
MTYRGCRAIQQISHGTRGPFPPYVETFRGTCHGFVGGGGAGRAGLTPEVEP